jgi:hypothetical protein
MTSTGVGDGGKRAGVTTEVKPCLGFLLSPFSYLVVSCGQVSSPSACPPSKNSLWSQLRCWRIQSSFVHSTHSTQQNPAMTTTQHCMTPRLGTLVMSPGKPRVLTQEATLPSSHISPPSPGPFRVGRTCTSKSHGSFSRMLLLSPQRTVCGTREG